MVGFGIDFGTTNSVAAVFDGQKITAFVDNIKRPHPSVLWYRGSGLPTVGREAKDKISQFGNVPGNYFVKSIKSRIAEEIEVQIFGKSHHTWEIAGNIFRFLKDSALKQNSEYPEIKEAVITIPLYFNGKQRQAIRKASEYAGISVKNFIHEPFAAVIGYLFSNPRSVDDLKSLKENILVFDWGGGTLDITLVKLDSGTICEVCNAGQPDRSGDYFDEKLMNDVIDRFCKENNINRDRFRFDDGIQSILSNEIELAKIELSKKDSSSVLIPEFLSLNDQSYSLQLDISRSHFESLINLDIQDAMSLVDQVLHSSRINSSQIGQVLLIGGTSKILLLDQMMRDKFGTTKVQRISDADTVIAEGAAIISFNNWQPYLVRPICIQLSDESHYTIFDKGTILKPEVAQKEIKFFCTDNREGEGVLIMADAYELGRYQVKEPIIRVPVSKVLRDVYQEKVMADIRVDRDIILRVSARGSIKGEPVYAEFHDICYGLRFA